MRARWSRPWPAGSMRAPMAARWLVRIEDVDTPRCVPGAAEIILRQLAACGLLPDEEPRVAIPARRALSSRARSARERRPGLPLRLLAQGHRAGPGSPGPSPRATRRAGLPRHLPHGPGRAPGPCLALQGGARSGRVAGSQAGRAAAGRGPRGRRLRAQARRRTWAYQLAVVVDDAQQGITQIVRGEDLADNTARQILLQQALRLPTPGYLHTALVLGPNGEKLSKQNGAQPLDTSRAAAGPQCRRPGARPARTTGDDPASTGLVAGAVARLLQSAG